ncbi:Methyl-accepting chemotaxis protein 4 [compost metagenome]
MFAEKSPLITEITTSPRQLIDAALNRDAAVFYDSLLLTEEGKFRGVMTVQDLMLMSRELQREADRTREAIVRESQARVLEIDQSVKEVSITSERSLRESEEMSGFATTGRSELGAVQASFSRVLSLTKSQAEQVTALQQHASNISSIAASIRELADRSGLLAMNASIEAAHAGEHGRGFAVVASEIRKLAHQTKQFSDDIGSTLSIISDLVRQTADASSLATEEMQLSHERVNSADHTFKMLVESVRSVESRGRDVYQTAGNAALKTEIVLQELGQLSGER